MLKKTRNRIKRLKRKTRRLRGGSTNSEKDGPPKLTDEEKRTKGIVQGVVTDVMKELKTVGVLENTSKKGPVQRQDTFSENRPTGIIEQILLAPVRIPAKLIKLPFKLYKAPFKFLKKLVF
jgi:hypothetical protein